MVDYKCPECGGGFPDDDADEGCPWCGEAFDNAGPTFEPAASRLPGVTGRSPRGEISREDLFDTPSPGLNTDTTLAERMNRAREGVEDGDDA
jgi:hypothetical protein